jgi:DNA-binding beta-propeller fold protein YncE
MCFKRFTLSAILIILAGAIILSIAGGSASASIPAYVSTIDGHMYIIDTDSGNVIGALNRSTPMVGYISASVDGHYVFTGGINVLDVIDTANFSIVDTIPYDNATFVTDLAAGPDGRLYIADFRRACIAIFDAASGAQLGKMQLGTPFNDYISTGDVPVALAISPDGNVLYVATGYNNWDAAMNDHYNVTAYDTKTGKAISNVRIGMMLYHMKLSPDGSSLYVNANNVDGSDNCIIPITTRDMSAHTPISLPAHPWSLALSPDGHRLYTANSVDKSVDVIDLGAGAVLKTIRMPNFAPSCSVTSDGRKLLVACGNSGLIAVDTDTYEVSTLNQAILSGPALNDTIANAIIVFGRVIVPMAMNSQATTSPVPAAITATPAAAAGTPSPAPAGLLNAPMVIAGLIIAIALLRRKP